MKPLLVLIFVTLSLNIFLHAQNIPYEKLDSISDGISKLQSEMDGKRYYDSAANFEMSFPEINFKVNFYNQLACRAIYKKNGNKESLSLTENIDLSKAIGIVSYSINKEFIKVSLYFPKEYLKTQIIEDGKVVNTITQEWIDFFCTNDKHTLSISKALFYLCTRMKKEKGLITAAEIAEQRRDITAITYEAYILKHPASLYTMHAKYYLKLQEEKKLAKEKLEVEGEEVVLSGGSNLSNSPESITPQMVFVTGGSFTMGNNSSDAMEEKPSHTVSITSFSMSKYETTVAEYKAFCQASGRTMPDAPSWGWNDKHPVVNVNFNDATAYCNWLSETTGKNYRLPTEAEWEYAARGGQKSNRYTYSGSNDLEEVGWSTDNAGGQTQATGRKQPNELGLYDMSGNVWEWCKDWYSESYYSSSPLANPRGATSGSDRISRGGAWYGPAARCRVAGRGNSSPEDRRDDSGFRVMLPQ